VQHSEFGDGWNLLDHVVAEHDVLLRHEGARMAGKDGDRAARDDSVAGEVAPELRRVHQRFESRGEELRQLVNVVAVRVRLVYVDARVRQYRYDLKCAEKLPMRTAKTISNHHRHC